MAYTLKYDDEYISKYIDRPCKR